MDNMSWYRVVIDYAGNLRSATQLETQSDDSDSDRVFYVFAADETAAAITAFERYRERQRQQVRDRRKRQAEAGLCQCSSTLNGRFKKCSRCRDRNRVSKGRSLLRAAGQHVPMASKVEAFAETKALRERELRKSVLLEVRKEWISSPSVSTFSKWLNDRIAEVSK
jgi:hypothetical protein